MDKFNSRVNDIYTSLVSEYGTTGMKPSTQFQNPEDKIQNVVDKEVRAAGEEGRLSRMGGIFTKKGRRRMRLRSIENQIGKEIDSVIIPAKEQELEDIKQAVASIKK